MRLTNEELKQFQHNQRQLLSMKEFFIATTNCSVALINETDLVPVLFEIECSVKELGDSVIFADVTQFTDSPSEQKTILFDCNTTFRLETMNKMNKYG